MKARNLKGSVFPLSLLFAIVFSVIFILAQVPRVQAWGWTTHRLITNEAEDVFSDGSFFSNHHSTLREWCIKPDQGWGESDWHYLDIITIDPLQTSGGELPWAVEDIFDDIVRELGDEDWQQAAELLGAISHFTADATMPLHATYDYWIDGMHSEYETAVNGRLGEISIPEYVPQELDNVFDATMTILYESFDLTDEDPEGGVNLSDFLEEGISWNDTIRSITENRLRAGVQFTANLWYTAMIRAGLTIQAPTLLEPENGTCATSDNLTFTWTSIDGTNFYDFQLASDNGFTSEVVTVKDLSTTSYTLENSLTEGSWY